LSQAVRTRTTSSLWIKVCGLTDLRAIEAAVAAGAQAVGFVFHEASPRHLDPARARVLAAAVPAHVEKVVVFRHPTQALLEAAIEAVNPQWVQTDARDLVTLHLPAGPRQLPVYRAATANQAAGTGAVADDGVLRGRCLVESEHSGTGERADWSIAARAARSCELVLAGGLDAANVGEAIATVRPFGVDVSSGVESIRGRKEPALIHEFVRAARAAESRLAAAADQGTFVR
jgi:phosphoribosylanthranilate isomerase